MKQLRHSLHHLFAFIACLVLLNGCAKSTDEQQVRAIFDSAEAAIESRDTSETLDLVSEDYKDERGLDKAQLRQYLRGYFLTHPKIELVISIGEIRFETKNLAHVKIDAVILGTQGPDERFNSDAPSLQVELRREQSTWRVTRVDKAHK
jgi:hypothetical protein